MAHGLRCQLPKGLRTRSYRVTPRLYPFLGVKRKSDFGAVRSVFDPSGLTRRKGVGLSGVEKQEIAGACGYLMIFGRVTYFRI
jgi:hypothetical protein